MLVYKLTIHRPQYKQASFSIKACHIEGKIVGHLLMEMSRFP